MRKTTKRAQATRAREILGAVSAKRCMRSRSAKRDFRRMTKYVIILFLFLGTFFIALGFNTVDQMVIRYKYYDDWRNTETWEMSYFWKPNWWSIYIISILMMTTGSAMLGCDAVLMWQNLKTGAYMQKNHQRGLQVG